MGKNKRKPSNFRKPPSFQFDNRGGGQFDNRGGGQFDNRGGGFKRSKRFDSSNEPLIGDPSVAETMFRLLCPAKKIGGIIGKGGDIIKMLRDETGAKIKVGETIPGTDERVVIIFSPSMKKPRAYGTSANENRGAKEDVGNPENNAMIPESDAGISESDIPVDNSENNIPDKNHENDGTAQNSENDGPTQNPENDGPIENPENVGPVDNPKNDDAVENPKNDGLDKNLENDDQAENPENDGLDKNLENVGQAENPENDGLAKNPENGVLAHIPENDGLAENPENDGLAENPENDGLAENPESDGLSEIPETDNLVENPENESLPENPKSDDVAENPKNDGLASNPENDVPTENEEELMPPHCSAQAALLKVHERIAADEDIYGGVVEEDNTEKDIVTARLLVPNNQVGCLLGKGGHVIQKLRNVTGANIRILPADHLPACAKTTDELVQISGPAAIAKRALYEVSTLLYNNPRPPMNFSVPTGDGFHPPGVPMPNMPPEGNHRWSNHNSDFRGQPPMSGGGGFGNEFPRFAQGGFNSSPAGHARKASAEFSMRILCPAEKIGWVIGKGGSKVMQIQNGTGASIRIEDASTGSDERVILVSSFDAPWNPKSPTIEAVLQLQISTKAKEGMVTTRLLVPSRLIGCLLGQGGHIINEMRRRSRADIRIISADRKPNFVSTDEELVQINGNLDVARDALIEVASRLRMRSLEGLNGADEPPPPFQGFGPPESFPARRTPPPGMIGAGSSDSYGHAKGGGQGYGVPFAASRYPIIKSSMEVRIPNIAVNSVLGVGGSNISNIGQMSGAKVKLNDPQSSGSECIVEIHGSSEQMNAAQNLLQSYISSAVQNYNSQQHQVPHGSAGQNFNAQQQPTPYASAVQNLNPQKQHSPYASVPNFSAQQQQSPHPAAQNFNTQQQQYPYSSAAQNYNRQQHQSPYASAGQNFNAQQQNPYAPGGQSIESQQANTYPPGHNYNSQLQQHQYANTPQNFDPQQQQNHYASVAHNYDPQQQQNAYASQQQQAAYASQQQQATYASQTQQQQSAYATQQQQAGYASAAPNLNPEYQQYQQPGPYAAAQSVKVEQQQQQNSYAPVQNYDMQQQQQAAYASAGQNYNTEYQQYQQATPYAPSVQTEQQQPQGSYAPAVQTEQYQAQYQY